MLRCDTSLVRVGNGGTGLTWDYTNLVRRGNDSAQTSYSDSTALTPQQRLRFRAADVVVVDDTTTSIYRTVNSTWRLVGRFTPSTEMIVGVDPYDVRPSEIVFNDPKKDTYNGTFQSSVPTPGVRPFSASHRYVYDGFGSLRLPDQTYPDVARISWWDTVTVEVTIGIQKAFVKSTVRTTSWQSVTSNIPQLVIEESTIRVTNASDVPLFAPFTGKSVRYLAFVNSTGIDDQPLQPYAVAPLPASGDHVTIMGLANDPSSITLINAAGQTVSCPMTSTGSGLRLDIRTLPAGTYYALIPEGYRLRTASFVKVK